MARAASIAAEETKDIDYGLIRLFGSIMDMPKVK
jgi:hypothetical protein